MRLFVALAIALFLAAFSAGCKQVSPETPTGTGTGNPDLAVWVPDGWTAPINFDVGLLELSVAWANRGSAMAEDYSIVLMADGEVIYRWDKPLLAPGSERTEVISLNDLPDRYLLVQGRHELKLVLDPDAVVPELDRRNNSFSLVREFNFQLPDLGPSAPADTGWDGPVVIGDSGLIYGRHDGGADRGYFLAFGVAYQGAASAKMRPPPHSIEVNGYQVPNREFLHELSPVLSPADVEVYAIPIWKLEVGGPPLLLGEQRFILRIDTSDSFMEADERNNTLAGRVNLAPFRSRSLRNQSDARTVTVQPVYAVPAGAPDEQWDINGTIDSIVADVQSWLRERTGGRGIFWDEADGILDITFVQLEQSASDLAGFPNSWEPLAEELYRRGLNDPSKIYAVWHPLVRDGSDTLICGVQTEINSVAFSFSFFKRVDRGPNLCINQPVTMVHELFHAFGAVAPCATNYTSVAGELRTAHVDDDPNDLMYDGDRTGIPIELDKGHDDYFNHEIEGCIDIADSPYLEPEN